jgi:hypothetical protein
LRAKLGYTNVPHELESVEEDVEDQMVREKQLEEGEKETEKRRQCVELPRPRTPEPTGLAMTAPRRR